MSRDKSERTPSKERREETKPSPPPTAYRSRMSLEKKLGVAFIGVLLAIFFAVLGVRLSNIDTDDERVEINVGGPPAVAQTTPPMPPTEQPRPMFATERTPPPSPPAAMMPPAPSSNAPPRYVAVPPPMPSPPTAAAPPSPPAFGGSTVGDRYATSPSNVASSSSPPPAAPSFAASPAAGTNPMRSPETSVATSPYGAPSPPSFGSTSPAPQPIGNAAASAVPLPREPGTATIGFAASPPPIASPPTVAAPPPVTPTPYAATTTTTTVAPPTATAPASVPRAQAYVVAPGDSFWSIAEKMYGDGSYYRALFAFNSDRYPHAEDVRTGSVLDVPTAEALRAKYPDLCGPNAGPMTAGGASPAMTGRSGVAVAGKTYVVQEGDTLFDIARRQLGKAAYWSEIYNLNRAALGENLERLRPGTELLLPEIPAQ